MILVVDASAIASIFLPEEQSEQAQSLLREDRELVAPDHLPVEIYSVVLRSLRRGRLTAAAVEEALTLFRSIPIQFIVSNQYLDAALDLAKRGGCSIYDALYIAVAKTRAAPVVTHDRRLAEVARAEGVAVIMVMDLPLP